MYILSFDIGVKNLAYCYFSFDKITDTTNINDWNVLDISTPEKVNHSNHQSKKLIEILFHKFNDLQIDYVIIENQPALKNPVMKTIQVMVFTFFQYQKVLLDKQFIVHIINARSKIKHASVLLKSYECVEIECKTTPSNKYKWNKEASILYTQQFLEYKNLSESLLFFKTFKKKDDLADTLLQGLYFAHLSSTTEPV
jgi:hypothetical protein